MTSLFFKKKIGKKLSYMCCSLIKFEYMITLINAVQIMLYFLRILNPIELDFCESHDLWVLSQNGLKAVTQLTI
jgi:hypothetical protein